MDEKDEVIPPSSGSKSSTLIEDDANRPVEDQKAATGEREEIEGQPPAPSGPPGPPPDGGLVAWLQVVGGFSLFFNTWGLMNTFGVFQTYYESGALFVASSSSISWIGSTQSFLALFMGIVVGPIYDRGYLRALLCVGSFLVVFGLMMLSLCTEWWQVFLAQGLCVGIGAGCLFTPCVSIMPTYFRRRLGLAQGISVAGSSLGGVIYPIVLYQLLDRIGFAWTVRVLGFIALVTLIVPIVVMRMRFKAAKPRALIDPASLRDVPYITFVLSSLIGFMGLTVALFYVSFFGEASMIVDSRMSFYLVPILNAASCFGRAAPAALSDKTGPFNIIAPATVIFGVVSFSMQAVRSEAALIVLTVLIGFFSGVLVAMPPICLAALTENKALLGTRIGMAFGVISFGMLAGGPGAGSILGDAPPFNWTGVWSFGGATATFAGLMYAGLRVARAGVRINIKA